MISKLAGLIQTIEDEVFYFSLTVEKELEWVHAVCNCASEKGHIVEHNRRLFIVLEKNLLKNVCKYDQPETRDYQGYNLQPSCQRYVNDGGKGDEISHSIYNFVLQHNSITRPNALLGV